jgi:L-lactate permease
VSLRPMQACFLKRVWGLVSFLGVAFTLEQDLAWLWSGPHLPALVQGTLLGAWCAVIMQQLCSWWVW